MKIRSLSSRHSQRGVALVVALIFLVVITITGISNVRTVAQEEKMTAATLDRSLAFQAAEAALRFGENLVWANHTTPTYTPAYSDADASCPAGAIDNCIAGICPPPDKDCPSRWEQTANFSAGWVGATVTLGSLAGASPQYFIEYLGNNFDCTDGGPGDPKNCKRYRITARSQPGAGRAAVMLQSLYKPE
jgi:type IV pilus assembly protein PilX